MKINKELINKLKQGHIAIDNTGNPNVELLRAVLREAFPLCDWKAVGNCINYSKNRNDNDWTSIIVNLPTIPLNDFSEKEFVLPEKWYVIVTEENISALAKWRFEKDYNDNWLEMGGVVGKVRKTDKSHDKKWYYCWENEITFEQFKEHVLKNLENNMENKEITHYKILKDVWGLNGQRWRVGEELHITNGESFPYFKETGLINNTNYFKPVYKSKEVVITVNNTIINIKGDRMIAEGKEFSIEYIQGARNIFNHGNSYNPWQWGVETIKIGCKTGWTKKHLDEIITAYNELQKQK